MSRLRNRMIEEMQLHQLGESTQKSYIHAVKQLTIWAGKSPDEVTIEEMREASRRGEEMGLREDELAFYDALADNPTAEEVLGNVALKQIAHELVDKVRSNTSIDWQLKESVQAKLRVLVKRILRKHGYPPDNPETGEYTVSVNKVLDQAELLADFWTGD